MKITKQLVWIAPLGLLIAGCAAPVRNDMPAVAQWQAEGWLPEWQNGGQSQLTPTGKGTTQVYAQTVSYPMYPASNTPKIVVDTTRQGASSGDAALADSIRDKFEYDRGMAPSLQRTTIIVRDGMVTLRGTVKSEMDGRLVVDAIRDIPGVTGVKNELAINSNWS